MKDLIILFDFDGVIVDTESQYTIFWDKMGKDYMGVENFGMTIKGQTLKQIFGKYFDGMFKEQEEIVPQLDRFESQMSYEYMPGFLEFITGLKSAGIPTAIVTSSNDDKMAHAFRAHPELPELVDAILTSEHFSKSKPDPECFLKGMEVLEGAPESTIVFEDSIHGINAGRASGAKVIGLATTNKSEVLTPLCDMVINDFTEISLKDITALLQQ